MLTNTNSLQTNHRSSVEDITELHQSPQRGGILEMCQYFSSSVSLHIAFLADVYGEEDERSSEHEAEDGIQASILSTVAP